MEKLNLIIITADDLSFGSLGCQKCLIDKISPNLDELSKKSINFINAHTVIVEVLKENDYYCYIIGKENHYSPFL